MPIFPFPALNAWIQTYSSNPSLFFVELTMLVSAALLIFLVLFATRDILLRSTSFFVQFFCILLVALLPGVGFLLYLLIRPPRTNREKFLEKMIMELSDEIHELSQQVNQRKVIPGNHAPQVFKMQHKAKQHTKDTASHAD